MSKRVWLITGISSGLGKAMAEAAMDTGDYVIGSFRNAEQVKGFNRANKGKGHAVLLDVTNHKLIDEVLSQIERVDILVNNAGIGFIGAIEETSMEETRRVFEANFFSALKITQIVLPKMRAQENGHIVQISSHGGIKSFAGFGIYNASKFALEGFSEALAQEVQPLGIKVSLIEPGPFRTEFASKNLPEAQKVIYEYADTAGAFRSKLKGVHGKQEGNPKKAAKAIIDLVNSKEPSLRLPLGNVPLTTIQMKLDSVKSDLEKNRAVSENVVF